MTTNLDIHQKFHKLLNDQLQLQKNEAIKAMNNQKAKLALDYLTGDLNECETSQFEEELRRDPSLSRQVKEMRTAIQASVKPDAIGMSIIQRAVARRESGKTVASVAAAGNVATPRETAKAFRLPSDIADAVADLIRGLASGAESVSARVLRDVPWGRTGGWTLPPGVLCDPNPDYVPPPDEQFVFEGGDLHVQVPSEKVPFGVLRVFLNYRPTPSDPTQDRLLASFLVAAPEKNGIRFVSIPVSEWTEGYRLEELEPEFQPASNDDLEILKWFPPKEVEELLSRQDGPLAADVRRLLDCIRAAGGGQN